MAVGGCRVCEQPELFRYSRMATLHSQRGRQSLHNEMRGCILAEEHLGYSSLCKNWLDGQAQRAGVNRIKSSLVASHQRCSPLWGQSCLISLSIIWTRVLSCTFNMFTDNIKLDGSTDLLEGRKTETSEQVGAMG